LKKRPKAKFSPRTDKIPRTAPQNLPDSILFRKPSWRFGLMDLNGPWGWLKIQLKDTLVEIVEKLKNFESMTWGEIDRERTG
jgi:hypothetical protein